jgi:hypothetical protein
MTDAPKPKKKPVWQSLLLAVVMAAMGGMFGFLVAKAGMAFLPASASLKALGPWDLLALPVIIVFVLAFHEAGHLAGGMSRGMRFLLFIAGPFGWVRGKDGVRFRLFFNLGTLGGRSSPSSPAWWWVARWPAWCWRSRRWRCSGGCPAAWVPTGW